MCQEKAPLFPSIKLKLLNIWNIPRSLTSKPLLPPSPPHPHLPDEVLKFAALLRDSILGQKTVSLKTLQTFAGKTTSIFLLVTEAKFYTNAVHNAISKVSRSGKPIPVSVAPRVEMFHLLFLDTWDGFLLWKEEKNSSIFPFSDVDNVGWLYSFRIPGKEDQLIRGYLD